MPRGFVRSVEGRTVTLVKTREEVEVKRDEDGKIVDAPETEVVGFPDKSTPVSINEVAGSRIADLKNGDEVIITKVGDKITNVVVTRPVDGREVPEAPASIVFTDADLRRHGEATE